MRRRNKHLSDSIIKGAVHRLQRPRRYHMPARSRCDGALVYIPPPAADPEARQCIHDMKVVWAERRSRVAFLRRRTLLGLRSFPQIKRPWFWWPMGMTAVCDSRRRFYVFSPAARRANSTTRRDFWSLSLYQRRIKHVLHNRSETMF